MGHLFFFFIVQKVVNICFIGSLNNPHIYMSAYCIFHRSKKLQKMQYFCVTIKRDQEMSPEVHHEDNCGVGFCMLFKVLPEETDNLSALIFCLFNPQQLVWLISFCFRWLLSLEGDVLPASAEGRDALSFRFAVFVQTAVKLMWIFDVQEFCCARLELAFWSVVWKDWIKENENRPLAFYSDIRRSFFYKTFLKLLIPDN